MGVDVEFAADVDCEVAADGEAVVTLTDLGDEAAMLEGEGVV